MILKLNWKDCNDQIYILGHLTYSNKKYYFRINEQGIKKAMKNGCMGIGSLNINEKFHVCENLFTFFKTRIPDESNININEILYKYKIKKYNEMELLKATKGMLITDNYFLT